MTEIEWWDFEDGDELADAVAGDVAFIIESALEARGQAILALAAGEMPLAIYARLAEKKIKWKNVIIVPTDERLVAMDDPLSNIAAIARVFIPLGARVVPLNSEAEDYRLAGSAAAARLADIGWPADLVWLEARDDGSTAGLYPGPDLDSALNAEKEQLMVGVQPDPAPKDAPVPGFTLTAPAIAQARTVLVTAEGGAQKKVLEAASEGEGDSPLASLLKQLTVPIDIYWLEG